MLEVVLHEITKEKETRDMTKSYTKYNPEEFISYRIPAITIHGRFQPPLHVNHFYTYVSTAFQIANKVYILITNPDLAETEVSEASHRSSAKNNPFTYDERVEIFTSFFDTIGIPKTRYAFKPFKITDDNEREKTLDKNVVNLVNTYGDWSNAKLEKFKRLGYKVIHSSFQKLVNISGTSIREIINQEMDNDKKKIALVENGLMPQAVDKVIEIHNRKNQK